MAAPIVIAKAAIIVGKEVQKRVPGGWITITALVTVMALVVPMLIFQGVYGAISPFFKGQGIIDCHPSVSNNNNGKDPHDTSTGSGPAGNDPWTTAGTPWPKEDSKTITYPAPNPVLSSPFGGRPPFVVNGILTPGFHNGLDFGQALGSPVLSMADGIVATAANGTSPYGSHVAIKHTIKGKHYTSVYGHIMGATITVKVGQTVKAGQEIAKVGQEGMSTGPHIHFVLTQDDYGVTISEPGWNGGTGGNSIDPASFLASNGAVEASGGLGGGDFTGVDGEKDTACSADGKGTSALEGDGFGSWGGFKNGEIPGISTLSFDSKASLISAGARDLEAMNAAYKKEFSKDLYVSDSYRDLAAQQSMYDSNRQVEKPGQSIYGWGRVVALNLGSSGENSTAYTWLQANAAKYGFAQSATYKDLERKYVSVWGYKGGGEEGDLPPATNADAAKARATAKKILEDDHGWGAKEYGCLVRLWEHESNWNYKAENPTSGAYGIVQALPPSKMDSVATDWRTNPATQIIWGLQYIEDRYGSPCGAWDFWQETDPAKKSGYPGNWY